MGTDTTTSVEEALCTHAYPCHLISDFQPPAPVCFTCGLPLTTSVHVRKTRSPGSRMYKASAPSPLRWDNSETCALQWWQSSLVEFQLSVVVTGLVTHLGWAAFPSLSHFLPPMAGELTSQVNC
jgi:hypothetical protein